MKPYTVKLETLKIQNLIGKPLNIPLLRVIFHKLIGLAEMKTVMREIDEITKDLKTPYASLTDFRELNLSQFFEKIFTFGMEKSYNSVFSVSNPAEISFIIITEETTDSEIFKARLIDINENNAQGKTKYNYIFIENEREMQQYAKTLM